MVAQGNSVINELLFWAKAEGNISQLLNINKLEQML